METNREACYDPEVLTAGLSVVEDKDSDRTCASNLREWVVWCGVAW